jgi:N-glycosylase/DNA lyase
MPALCTLRGVGPKVADCIALFSCDQTGCIPVDVHVWRIACRDYDTSLQKAKSLTPTIYERVGDLFREKYGSHAGWAHSLLFAAELPAFRVLLPEILQKDMAAFKLQEKELKASAKLGKVKRQTATDKSTAKDSMQIEQTALNTSSSSSSSNKTRARSESSTTSISSSIAAGVTLQSAVTASSKAQAHITPARAKRRAT